MPRTRAGRPGALVADSVDDVYAAACATIRSSTAGLHDERKWSNDWRAGTDLILCCGAFRQHVGIEFWRGSSLADNAGLLEGTGKNLRHVKLRTVAEAKAPALRALIREAVELDRREPKRTR